MGMRADATIPRPNIFERTLVLNVLFLTIYIYKRKLYMTIYYEETAKKTQKVHEHASGLMYLQYSNNTNVRIVRKCLRPFSKYAVNFKFVNNRTLNVICLVRTKRFFFVTPLRAFCTYPLIRHNNFNNGSSTLFENRLIYYKTINSSTFL